MTKGIYEDTFAGRVRYCRTQREWTQETLAEKAAVSIQFVSGIEQGRTNVRTDYVVRIADALEVSVDYLLRGDINAIDAGKLMAKISCLSGKEFTHLENIVVEYCESHKA